MINVGDQVQYNQDQLMKWLNKQIRRPAYENPDFYKILHQDRDSRFMYSIYDLIRNQIRNDIS